MKKYKVFILFILTIGFSCSSNTILLEFQTYERVRENERVDYIGLADNKMEMDIYFRHTGRIDKNDHWVIGTSPYMLILGFNMDKEKYFDRIILKKLEIISTNTAIDLLALEFSKDSFKMIFEERSFGYNTFYKFRNIEIDYKKTKEFRLEADMVLINEEDGIEKEENVVLHYKRVLKKEYFDPDKYQPIVYVFDKDISIAYLQPEEF